MGTKLETKMGQKTWKALLAMLPSSEMYFRSLKRLAYNRPDVYNLFINYTNFLRLIKGSGAISLPKMWSF